MENSEEKSSYDGQGNGTGHQTGKSGNVTGHTKLKHQPLVQHDGAGHQGQGRVAASGLPRSRWPSKMHARRKGKARACNLSLVCIQSLRYSCLRFETVCLQAVCGLKPYYSPGTSQSISSHFPFSIFIFLFYEKRRRNGWSLRR